MQKINKILTIIILISASLLVASYFLPVETSWAPLDAWNGYYNSNTEFVSGFNVGLVEVFPYAVGAIILFAMVVLRWPKICIVAFILFSVTWIISLLYEVNDILWNQSSYQVPKLWLILTVLIVPTVVFFLILVLRKFKKKKVVLAFAAILSFSSILYQACSIAWYLLEDGLLLNIGSVTGITSSTVLFILLSIKNLCCDE